MMRNSLWKTFDEQYSLAGHTTHIFKLKLNDHIEFATNHSLSNEELKKSDRFHQQADKDNFVIRRTILRVLLGKFLNVSPHRVEFNTANNKKPVTRGLHFNTSHSKDYILIGIGTRHLGVDMEFINRSFDISDFQNHCFSREESEFLVNSDDLMLNFYKLWTRKESLLKATGEGLVDDLHRIAVVQDLVNRNNEYYQMLSVLDQEYMISISCAFHTDLEFNFWNCI